MLPINTKEREEEKKETFSEEIFATVSFKEFISEMKQVHGIIFCVWSEQFNRKEGWGNSDSKSKEDKSGSELRQI